MNFPNYFTNKNPILEAFRELDKKEKTIDIYLYVPSEQVLKEIEEYIIYKKKNLIYFIFSFPKIVFLAQIEVSNFYQEHNLCLFSFY